MLETLSTDQLRTFATIADTGSYTHAAEKLYRSQPALSIQIKRLEEQLGAQLFDRSGRTSTLTEAGRVLLTYATRILDLNEEAIGKLTMIDEQGTVRVGVLEEVTHGPLLRLLTRFGKLCTRIKIELEVANSWDLIERVQKNELCLAIANSAYGDAPHTPLWNERYLWATSVDYDLSASGPLQLIADPEESPCVGWCSAVDGLKTSGREYERVFSSMSLLATQAAIRAGLGVGIIAESATTDDMVILGSAEGLPEIADARISLYRGSEAQGAAAGSLFDFLLSHLQKPEMAPA
jgi:DNA-binding transcriptional LysR family regulator